MTLECLSVPSCRGNRVPVLHQGTLPSRCGDQVDLYSECYKMNSIFHKGIQEKPLQNKGLAKFKTEKSITNYYTK